MLGRYYDGINTYRTTVVIVFDSYLALRVRTKVSHHLSFTTDVGQYHQQFVCQVERQRHVVFSFVGSITEHHTLVACSLIHRVFAFYSTVDVRTLFVNGREYTA